MQVSQETQISSQQMSMFSSYCLSKRGIFGYEIDSANIGKHVFHLLISDEHIKSSELSFEVDTISILIV